MRYVTRDALRKIRRHVSLVDPSLSAFETQKTILSNVESPIVFDVGANIGQTTDICREMFPDSRIFAFEPHKASFDHLKAKCDEVGNALAFELSLSSVSGKQNLHLNPSAPTNSLLATDQRGPAVWGQGLLETKDTVQVEVIRLDDFLADKKIDRIDLMKLDVQGAEHLVLEGAVDSLRENRISVLYTEIITMPTYVGQKLFHEMLKIYDDHNFQLCNIYNHSAIDGWLRQVDAIFVNREFAKTLPGGGPG
jgi:FkbM family methyltransferase